MYRQDRFRSRRPVLLPTAQRRDLDAESRLLEVRRQQLDTRVDLYLALGGGLEPIEFKPPSQIPEEENPS